MVFTHSPIRCLKSQRWRHDRVSHLLADSVGELHAFADRVGIPRCWFHNGSRPHYDLTPAWFQVALNEGAVCMERREFVKQMLGR